MDDIKSFIENNIKEINEKITIFKNNPKIHFDIGSRIDGFVAHVASFRKIYVFDVRKLKLKNHPNIIFKKISGEKIKTKLVPDSISCLHALEHFGLGRYGDNINPNAHLEALTNFTKILKKNGFLYLSFPVTNKYKTCFNANRIFELNSFMNFSVIKKKL